MRSSYKEKTVTIGADTKLAEGTVLSRRAMLVALAALPLAACQQAVMNDRNPALFSDGDTTGWYVGSMPDKPHDVPLVDRSKMRPELNRQTVDYPGNEKPGTIVVDIDKRFLYLVQPGNKALRYGVGVGRQGFSWKGVATIGNKTVWPDWRPTPTMVRLNPKLPAHMAAGVDNPLGARALYLYQGGRDILFRIHGTNEPWSIGEQVSSGCIRMLNEDVVDLYSRVPVGTTVLVRRNGQWRV